MEKRLERAAIPFKAGEYLVITTTLTLVVALAGAFVIGSPLAGLGGAVLAIGVAWKLPSIKTKQRTKKLQQQLPDALSLMAASVEGGQSFQRAIDMYRHDARAPLSEELNRVMAEVAVGSDLVLALENMANRCDVDDLKWAVEAVRIQQTTGGRLAPILHTLADFMRMRQEVRREVQTLSAEGRVSGYVLFALPLFIAFFIVTTDPSYLETDVSRCGTCRPNRHRGTDGIRLLDCASHGQHRCVSWGERNDCNLDRHCVDDGWHRLGSSSQRVSRICTPSNWILFSRWEMRQI